MRGSAPLAFSKSWIEYAARSVEFAAALVIAIAALQAAFRSILLFCRRDSIPQEENKVRLTMARRLALALEFELAADILNTAVTPTWSDIEKLAAIAAIRTALNFFLEREINAESRPRQQAAEQTVVGTAVSAPLPKQ